MQSRGEGGGELRKVVIYLHPLPKMQLKRGGGGGGGKEGGSIISTPFTPCI